jgi:PadR family transcriptional regulator, regulatory protein PadR
MKLVYLSALVLRLFLEDPGVSLYGLQLMTALQVTSGTLYPVLQRMEDEGLIASEREQADPRKLERPVRRYYRLTPAGVRYARRELAALADQLRPPE